MQPIILAINPGSSSTKVAVYRGVEPLAQANIRHDLITLKGFSSVMSQKNFRLGIIVKFVEESGFSFENIDYYVARGGLLRPLKSGGAYVVNQAMVDDLYKEENGSHASNLGAILAYELATKNDKKAFIVDPVIIDELDDIARVSGLSIIERKSIFHALNQRAMAIRYADIVGKAYNELILIVAHLGGGVSIGLHKYGRVVDVNNALGGDGPFSPERAGNLPINQLIDLCYSNKYSYQEMKKLIVGEGGLASYLGTSDGFAISQAIDDNDKKAAFYLEAMAYRIVKEIGGLHFAASNQVDAVIITGGFANSKHLIKYIKKYLPKDVNVRVYPGEDEIFALVQGILRVHNNQEKVQEY